MNSHWMRYNSTVSNPITPNYNFYYSHNYENNFQQPMTKLIVNLNIHFQINEYYEIKFVNKVRKLDVAIANL